MPRSLASVLIQIVFSTKDRIPFLKDQTFHEELHAQLGGTSSSLNCPPIIVGGVDDHIHMLARHCLGLMLHP
ncbi:MAG: transposase [Planctomycetes bacterium]|nr:transposase [Planctomycetota bacterium]